MSLRFNPFTSNFDIVGSGSSSTPAIDTYMFADIASDVGGYYQAVSLPSYSVGAAGNISTVVTTSPTLMGSFVTNIGFPNITVIPAGLISYHCDTEKVAGANNYYIYAELYKRDAGGTETLLATSDTSTQSASNAVINQTVTGFVATNTTLLSTDRLVTKFYGVMLSSSATIHLYFDDATSARLTFPSAPVDATNFIPYTGATLNVDLGAKTIVAGNLSGTNTGDQNLSGLVPYTGATGNVDLGANSLTATDITTALVTSASFNHLENLAQNVQDTLNNLYSYINSVASDLSNYVPYIGANTNVDLGTNTITAFSFNCSATSTLDGIESLTITVLDDPYSASWDGSTEVPTKNAIYDKIETISEGFRFENRTSDPVSPTVGQVWLRTDL